MKKKSLAGVLLICSLCCAVAVGMSGCGTNSGAESSASSVTSSASSSSASVASSSTSAKTDAVADEDAAVAKACAKIGIDVKEATDSKCEKATSSGKTVFNGFVHYDEFDYDFQIDAQSGDFLHWDRITSTGEMPNWEN
ncbi:MAG: hypothetical protein LKJ83_10675 [Eubacteriaceae bacterium]|jgi:uncharacterized membrane protein YkoI|nr:hypothetical protein [Eubacteriaceae bacterium]